MNRAVAALLAAVAVSGAIAPPVTAQVSVAPTIDAPVPFLVGENLTYDVRFGAIKVGTARMRVLGVDSIRDRPAWHVLFTLSGGTIFYKVDDSYESWMDVTTLNSLRYVQRYDQGSRRGVRQYEIFPERSVFEEVYKKNRIMPSVADPLDDGSFLFFIRTVPLEVGRTYRFDRYFKPDRNPVTIRVLRRERVRVPAGAFDAIVIQPIIKTSGIFSEGGAAEIWLSDDDKRMMLQMKSRLSFGSLNLFLRAYRWSADSTPPGAVP